MRIKLAVLDEDVNYLNRIARAFQGKLSDSVEIHTFTDLSVAYASMSAMRVDVLLAYASFEIDTERLPKGCGFAHLVNSPDIRSYNGQRAVCKYQRVGTLYNYIADIYSENSHSIVGMQEGGVLPLYVFTSASGGVGTSVAAVSCAMKFAEMGRNTAYLNFERYGNPAVYFSGTDSFTMTDVIFAIKSKRLNLPIKLRSNIQRDTSGVYWFPAPKNPLDLQGISSEEITELLNALAQTGMFDCIVADVNFDIDDMSLTLFHAATTLVFVSDGSETANEKYNRAYSTLVMVEEDKGINITNRIAVLYNKFSNKNGEKVDVQAIQTIGGIPKIERAKVMQVVAQILKMEVFSEL